MKIFISIVSFLLFTLSTNAQSGSKVSWKYSAKKLTGNQYEIKLSATIQPGWHLYSQNQSAEAIALPTTITFTKNPLVTLDGKTTESGKLIDQYEKATASRSKYYLGSVVFTQKVTVKGSAKTSVNGQIEFMVCDDKQCLPPEIVKFSVKL
jgi:DsbC/DsbD-like thiol-disulfide interchange protein